MSKRRRYILLVSGLSLIAGVVALKVLHASQQSTAFLYVDFDRSMQTDRFKEKLTPEWGEIVLCVARQLYARNNAHTLPYDERLKIPRIIHQIWLGSPFPEKYRAWQRSWIEKHPQWEYHLWTDADVERLHKRGDFFIGDTYRYYQEATNYAEQSDILRLLLLYQYGGLYIDTDFECIRSLEILHHYYDFYIGLQPLDVAMVQLGFALIGAAPRHPFIKAMLDFLHQTRTNVQILSKTGPIMATACFARFALQMPGAMVALPASYFYPRCYNDPIEPRSAWLVPEAFAVHQWEGSWLLPQAQRRG